MTRTKGVLTMLPKNGTAVLGSVINEVWEQTFQWVGRVGEVVMVLLRE